MVVSLLTYCKLLKRNATLSALWKTKVNNFFHNNINDNNNSDFFSSLSTRWLLTYLFSVTGIKSSLHASLLFLSHLTLDNSKFLY